MGKKGKWFGAVKKVFSPDSKKSKKKLDSESFENSDLKPSEAVVSEIHSEEVKLVEAEKEQNKHVYTVAVASAAAADAAVAAAQAAAEVVRLTTPVTKSAGQSREEIAAIKIQTAFRGHLARRALRALRGLMRLKSLLDGNSVKRQVTTTLRSMQTLARVQGQIRSRRVRMSEENQALQRQLLLKHERELENQKLAEEWDDSLQTKEQIEASVISKQEAALRRERAMAYAFTHQWKGTSRSANPMFMDPRNPQWGWSWLERWMAAKPWETKKSTDRELINDNASVKSTGQSASGGEILKSFAQRDTSTDKGSPVVQKPRPPSRQSPSTSVPRAPWTMGKIKSASPRSGFGQAEDDTKSIASIQSERARRHSIATSLVRDDESLGSSPPVPSYMTPTESARAKSRFHSPSIDDTENVEKLSNVGSVKKRLSFPASPAPMRRHSGPPKVDLSSVKNVEVES